VAVIVADLEAERVDNAVLFKTLKRSHPQTLVIVATAASDSELIIGLINEARIFRFVNKPVNLSLLRSCVVAALERHRAFKRSPNLVQTQASKRSAGDETKLGQSILGKLRSITGQLIAPFRP
jgi:DNA-binding NtrC family response regulator